METVNKRKRRTVAIFSFVLLAALICLCPLPKRIHTTLQGVKIDPQAYQAEGVPSLLEEPASIELTGWHFRFLFFDDMIRLSVETEDELGQHEVKLGNISPIRFTGTDGKDYMTCPSAYFNDQAQLRRVTLHVTADWKEAVFFMDGAADAHIIVAAADSSTPLLPIAETFCTHYHLQ